MFKRLVLYSLSFQVSASLSLPDSYALWGLGFVRYALRVTRQPLRTALSRASPRLGPLHTPATSAQAAFSLRLRPNAPHVKSPSHGSGLEEQPTFHHLASSRCQYRPRDP